MELKIRGDSADYEVLSTAANLIRGIQGLTIEIGVREGMGSYTIMQTLLELDDKRPHIGLDPYGNIEYRPDERRTLRADYDNGMRIRTLAALAVWAGEANYLYYPVFLEDTEYFRRYEDGFPLYSDTKYLEREYALVHYDGPHTRLDVAREIAFFSTRTPIGGIWVFDDVRDYNHPHDHILDCGFELVVDSPRKMAYRRIV